MTQANIEARPVAALLKTLSEYHPDFLDRFKENLKKENLTEETMIIARDILDFSGRFKSVPRVVEQEVKDFIETPD